MNNPEDWHDPEAKFEPQNKVKIGRLYSQEKKDSDVGEDFENPPELTKKTKDSEKKVSEKKDSIKKDVTFTSDELIIPRKRPRKNLDYADYESPEERAARIQKERDEFEAKAIKALAAAEKARAKREKHMPKPPREPGPPPESWISFKERNR